MSFFRNLELEGVVIERKSDERIMRPGSLNFSVLDDVPAKPPSPTLLKNERTI